MNARRAARELALLTLFQLSNKDDRLDDKTLQDRLSLRDLMLTSVRTLEEEARQSVREAADEWAAASQAILTLEQEHPLNLETPIEAESQPVPLPTTREMLERLEKCLQAAELLFEALEIPEFSTHARQEEIQRFAERLLRAVHDHQTEVDELLNQCMDDWRVDRLVKMDRMLLRLAAAEMKYIPEVDLSVSINEAVELSKRFSTQESFRFINGVLGKLANVFQGKVPVASPDALPDVRERGVAASEELRHV